MSGKYLRDPVHGEIFILDELLPLVTHPLFQRLNRVLQQGLVYLVYPSAVHTRFAHSLGTYHIVTRADPPLPTLAYALLHDVGHGPFSHLSEIALRRYGENFDHDDRTKELIPEILADSVLSPREVLSSPENILVSGCVGADRLDYLCRDSYFAGISVGTIAWDRIMRNVTISGNELSVSYKILPNVEHLFVSRFILGDALYLHKTAIIADNMFVRGIGDLLEYHSAKEIVAMDDAGLISAFRETDNKWWKMLERRELFDLEFKDSDRENVMEKYERLVAELGEENVIFGERIRWHSPPQVVMEDGRLLEDVSPLVASLLEADRRRHYFFVAVRR